MSEAKSSGFMIAAPASGSGKTTITLGLIRALKNAGLDVHSAKTGPDFIDPAFHAVAGGNTCFNLDPWAMRSDLIGHLASRQQQGGGLVVEAMMGLFDGAADGTGSAADLAIQLGLPVVLVVDAARQSHSIAALVQGFSDFNRSCHIAGVILNRVGSARHETMLREALDAINVPVLGCVFRSEKLVLPSRHLGLVQANEHDDIEGFISRAGVIMTQSLDLDALAGLKVRPVKSDSGAKSLPPLGQRIAIADDKAFAFAYPHLLQGWREQGAEVKHFSPLADEQPPTDCDAVFLPGGYPELYGGVLAGNSSFLQGLKDAAARDNAIYGECGGFMVLGEALVDADGARHTMANLLPLVTSFAKRKLHLGYRLAEPLSSFPPGPAGQILTAHEFHYSSVVEEGKADRLFAIRDARGENLGECGLKRGNVMGSYLHIIDRRD